MARICEVCGRGSLKSIQRCYSKKKTIKHKHVNLQSMMYHGKRVQACARCIRTQTKRMHEAAAKQK